MSELPKGWVQTELGSVTNYGTTIKPDLNNINDDCWVLELEDIEKDSSKLLKRLSFAERSPKSSKNAFLKGDVLYGKLRPYLNKMLIAPEDGICTTEIVPLKVPNDLFENRFLFYWLKGKQFSDYVNAVSYGVNMPRLGTKDGKKAPMVVAPLPEQKRIVEKLDEVLAQVDTIKARLDGIPDLLKRFRQSVLASAVSGKLTEEWRAKNSFDTKAQLKSIRKLNPSKPPKDELAKFHELPSCWEWALVKQVGEVQLGRQRAPKYHQGNNMRPYLRVANVMEGYIDTSDIMEMVFDESDFERYKLLKGDVLLNEGQSHELVGRPSMFNDELENVCFTNTLVRFRAYDGVHNKFAFFVFLNQMKTGRFQQIASRTVNISHLGAGRFADIEFPFPPLEEQTEIVRLVDQYFAFADTIEAQVKKAQARVDNLTQSILAKAFRGELVPQDPNDEPAEVLLERIAQARKEAEALAKAAKKAGKKKA
ncbi:restriction endonuclease subunit S [Vibrio fluvialis]|nr:restriction endonuclease subunit S [Vibrio fluvialis]